MKKNGLWSSFFAGIFLAISGWHTLHADPAEIMFPLPPVGGWLLLGVGCVFALRSAYSLWAYKGASPLREEQDEYKAMREQTGGDFNAGRDATRPVKKDGPGPA